ncbi:ABC transporter ATP-binding protein [Microbacterium sp. NPDC089695]|uniref:ABC transporter ATP-binding protein n=1 Tax=Microbacterium sp. NPDC089695 TaxID=3364198 RepID=UPI003812FE80
MTSPLPQEPAPLLEARDITMSFRVRGTLRRWGAPARRLTAVNGVSFVLHAGEVVAVVGESGSGKSTIAKVLSQLQRQSDGEVLLRDEPVRTRGTRSFRRYCAQVQLIFQDPFASLNPLRTVRYHLADPVKIHGRADGDVDRVVRELLEQVKLSPAERYIDKYPHELSGGQRQRVSIARALAAAPDVILADEPVSMLDVSIRLGILNLLKELKERLNLGILYITHDIASARHFADRVLVMYAGEIVESGDAESVTQDPKHPYTRLLIDSAPNPDDPSLGQPVKGADVSAEPPSLIDPPSGCRFHPRCPLATAKCAAEAPPEIPVGDGRVARCWAYSTAPSDLPLPRIEEAAR